MKSIDLIGFCLSAVLAFASPASAQLGSQKLYQKPIDLGTLPGGTFSTAVADGVNNPSRVVGFADTTGGAIHGFLWLSKTGMKDLGTLGGANSHAQGINDGAQIVGYSDTSNGSTDAFLYTTGAGMQDIGTLAVGIVGGSLSQANAINFDAGTQAFTQTVGQSLTSDGTTHAVIWDASLHIADLGTLAGPGTNSAALGNNCVGQVVGSSDNAGGTTSAFLWDSVHGMQDLGTLGGTLAVATAINCNGQIVGTSTLAGDAQFDAFLITGGTRKDLGNPGPFFSQANAVNDPGTVVGFFVTPDGLDTHAFVWTAKGGMQDLNNLIPAGTGWDLQSANSISNSGKIVGTGTLNGGAHAFLLTPLP